MNKSLFVAALLAAACAGGVAAEAQAWNGDVNLLLAGKGLSRGDWGSVDRQGEIGLQTDLQRTDWPVAVAADLLFSGTDVDIASGGFTEERGRTSELDLGVRKVWRGDATLRPYVGGGLALASAEMEFRGPFRSVTDSDSGVGPWIGGGVYWTLSRVFNVGFDAKITHAPVRLFDSDKSAGGLHLGLLLGCHFGA